MKKLARSILVLILVLALLAAPASAQAVEDTAQDILTVEFVTIDITNAPAVLRRNATVTLGAAVVPAVMPQDVIWTSSNPTLASVSETGVVHARAATGIVVITARTTCGQVAASVTIRLSA